MLGPSRESVYTRAYTIESVHMLSGMNDCIVNTF